MEDRKRRFAIFIASLLLVLSAVLIVLIGFKLFNNTRNSVANATVEQSTTFVEDESVEATSTPN